MNHRTITGILLSLSAMCAAAVSANLFPKWTAFLMLLATGIQAFLRSVMEAPPPPPDGTKKAPSLPPLAMLMLSACLVLSAVGCKGWTAKDVVYGGLAIAKVACVVAQSEMGYDQPKVVATLCDIPSEDLQQIADLLLAQKRGKEIAAAQRAALARDAGAARGADAGAQ